MMELIFVRIVAKYMYLQWITDYERIDRSNMYVIHYTCSVHSESFQYPRTG